jgi:hypothetical protein
MRNRKIVMMYKGYINEIELPDQTLGLYVMEKFVLNCRNQDEEWEGVPLLA